MNSATTASTDHATARRQLEAERDRLVMRQASVTIAGSEALIDQDEAELAGLRTESDQLAREIAGAERSLKALRRSEHRQISSRPRGRRGG